LKTLAETLAEAEVQHIHYAILVNTTLGAAARALGISRKSLWEKMRKYNIKKGANNVEQRTA
jgi:transcriptional regulator with PAS, ATPase and Fis domain